jgi:hypothetical protein
LAPTSSLSTVISIDVSEKAEAPEDVEGQQAEGEIAQSVIEREAEPRLLYACTWRVKINVIRRKISRALRLASRIALAV